MLRSVNRRPLADRQMIECFDDGASHFAIRARLEAHRDVTDRQVKGAAVAFIDREGPTLGESAALAIAWLRHWSRQGLEKPKIW